MEGNFSTDWVHKQLDEITDACWVSLHYDSPGLNGTGAAEISGGGYVRAQALFTPPANRAIWTTTDVAFKGLTQNRLTHYGLWETQYQGAMIAYGPLPEPVLVLNGQGYIIHEGDLVVSIG